MNSMMKPKLSGRKLGRSRRQPTNIAIIYHIYTYIYIY